MQYKELESSGSANIPSHQGLPWILDEAFIGPPEPPGLRRGRLPRSPDSDTASDHPEQETYREAAIRWFQFGLQVIPVLPQTKQPACKWDPWLDNMSVDTIESHWAQYPAHELGFIVGPALIVFDADSPEAITAFHQLMASFDLTCNHTVKTRNGEHYYFRRAAGTIAKSDSHDTSIYPARLDIKTGRALVILPPSTGKTELVSEADSAADLVEVGQDFIDAVYRHNGRDAPTAPIPYEPVAFDPSMAGILAEKIAPLLDYIDPDYGYHDWLSVLMAVHHESDGDTAGLQLVNEWSSKGSKYRGQREIEQKWQSFDGHSGIPVTIATIRKLAVDNGADLEKLNEEFFEPLDDEEQASLADAEAEAEEHELAKYSLRGMSSQLEAEMQEQKFVLGEIAILGQSTLIFAPPNTGKSLITLSLAIEAIKNGSINPESLFFVNADDTQSGLTLKLKLAETHGFHMLAPGYRDFHAKNLMKLLRQLSVAGRARDTIVILDTLKKFTDLMHKGMLSDFGNAVREFIAKGGTVIALAHVNKHRNLAGKLIHAGASDSVDDADCAYLLDTIGEENGIRTVQFENIKSRGMVSKQAAYQYSSEGLGYLDLLASVTPVDDTKASALKQAADRINLRDVPLIQAITDCIDGGIKAKTKIAEHVASVTGDSVRHALRVLEKHCGDDPKEHNWKFTIGPRGANLYELHPTQDDAEDIVELQD